MMIVSDKLSRDVVDFLKKNVQTLYPHSLLFSHFYIHIVFYALYASSGSNDVT